MATALQAFTNHEFGTIRSITSDGQVLFCGKDVVTARGYTKIKDALARHCKGAVNHYPLETAGGIQQLRFITEGDLYRLIVSSKLPAAQKFEAWVFDDVLPSIRRHGLFAIDELFAYGEFLERAFATVRAERAKRLAAEQALMEAAPKVSYYDVVLASPSLITTLDIGISKKNIEGYPNPTCYKALKEIQRAEVRVSTVGLHLLPVFRRCGGECRACPPVLRVRGVSRTDPARPTSALFAAHGRCRPGRP
ncbi:BRO-N domain-containing protein [Corynebacterium atypicum]|uniref:BRO-N domain-containing protein n=1 Tax=Corynebacterium atypicum TaxID=191610 RepID=UPI000AB4BB6F|nr:BRO family protein [Corynebacterium atypicum]